MSQNIKNDKLVNFEQFSSKSFRIPFLKAKAKVKAEVFLCWYAFEALFIKSNLRINPSLQQELLFFNHSVLGWHLQLKSAAFAEPS